MIGGAASRPGRPAQDKPVFTSPAGAGMSSSGPPSLFSLRTAVVLTLGLLCGAIAAVLTLLAGAPVAAAILAGLSGAGGAISFFNKVIHR